MILQQDLVPYVSAAFARARSSGLGSLVTDLVSDVVDLIEPPPVALVA